MFGNRSRTTIERLGCRRGFGQNPSTTRQPEGVALRCDNGSEFTSQIVDLWAYHHQVTIAFSRPGKPTDNAFIDSFNGALRDECLNAHWFESLRDAKMQIEQW